MINKNSVIMILIICIPISAGLASAGSASDGQGTMEVSPNSVTVGSTGNSFNFTFTVPNNAPFISGSQATIFIPLGWTPPQSSTSSSPGYISLSVGSPACTGLSIGTITGSGPWTIHINMICSGNGANRQKFILTYAGGLTKVTAPTTAGINTFTTKTKKNGGTLTEIATSPVVTVNKASTTTTVVSSVNPSIFGQSVTFTASVSPSTASGTVQFKIDSSNFGSAVTLSSGSATSSAISSLSVGNHPVTAVYNGDGSYTTNTGTLIGEQTVTNPKPAGNCPAYNGVKNGNSAPSIDANLLAFIETGTSTRTISVVTSNQNSPTTGDIVPGIITICKYPLNSNGNIVDPQTIVYSIVSSFGNPLWANDIACGSGDCIRFGRTTGEGNRNNIPMDGRTQTVGSITFSSLPVSELIVAHINWPAICGTADTCFRTLSPALPALKLNKTASPSTYKAKGDKITYTYEITNLGNVYLAGPFNVLDDHIGLIGCGSNLVPGKTISCTAKYTITIGDLSIGHVTNIATASGNKVTSNQAQATVYNSDVTPPPPVPELPTIVLVGVGMFCLIFITNRK